MKKIMRIDIQLIRSNYDIEVIKPIFEAIIFNKKSIRYRAFSTFILIDKVVVGDGIYERILEEIHKLSLEHKVYESREYTKKELNNATLLDVFLYSPYEHRDVTDSKELGTLYDEQSMRCKNYGMGEKQLTELIIDTRGMGKHQIANHYPNIIVTEYTKNVIESNELTGCEFRAIIDYKNREITQRLYQLIITNALLEMNSDSMRFEYENYCNVCSRGKVLRSEIIYNKNAVKQHLDFNNSKELIGFGGFCRPRIIVSARVRELFEENSIKVLKYGPVELVE